MASKKKTSAIRKPIASQVGKAPKFADLSVADRRRVAAVIAGSMKRIGYFGRGGYKVVHGPDQLNREWTSAEHGGETDQLTSHERNRLIAFARNAARNSHHLEGALHQLEINVAGVEGGKAVFNFPAGYEAAAEQIKEAFAEWAQEAEYFDDASLQMALRWVLRTQMLGGDMALVFDWGITKGDTGQIIAFEPDCIGNIDANMFTRLFPGCTQTQGIIKNADGKTIGVIVSWSQRGLDTYKLADADGRRMAWPLIKPVGQKWNDSLFTLFRGMTRFNQVRGSSRLWPGLGTIKDLSDTQGYELQSAKRGAQTIGQVTQSEEKNEDELARELDPDATAPIQSVGGDDYEAAISAAQEAAEDDRMSLDLEAINSAGAIYDVMPPGVRMELFDTKHPNDKLVEFSRWMHGSVAFALGLGDFVGSGKAESSYSAAMAELMMSNVEFRDEFAKLRRGFLDWAFTQWSRRAQYLGIIPGDDKLPPHWRRRCVDWQEPQRHAINPVDEQTALNSGLKNGTILYRDKLGPDWREKVSAFVEEVEFFRAHNIPHPALQTVSGGIIESSADGGSNEGDE